MEKYEDSTKDITNYEYEKAEKKLRLMRNEFTTTGKFNFPIISKQEIDLDCIDTYGIDGGTPNGNRTRDYTVRGCRLSRLTIGACKRFTVELYAKKRYYAI